MQGMQEIKERWPPATQVRLVHDVGRMGTVASGNPRGRNGRWLIPVQFSDRREFIPEDQLEPLPEGRMDPLTLLGSGRLISPRDMRRTLLHVRLTGRLADIIYSMEATNTDFYAYQFKPVLKLLQAATKGLLIADEVGLGKTIEAGLIWTELRSRFNLRKLVVLCPAALREKWRDELTSKMGLSPSICDAKETLRILKDDQARARGFAIIASMDGLRPPRGWEENGNNATSARLAEFLHEMANEEPLIDLLVVDEAHHMRNPQTQRNKLGELMRGVSEYRVLLTATPVHNRNRDLLSLLHLLDPDTFEREGDFERILRANEPLVRARELALAGKTDELRETLSQAERNPLLRGNRQIKTLLDRMTDATLDSRAERSRIAHRLETINLLGHTFTRTRKRDVEAGRVVREPRREFIEMTEMERQFYDAVTDIVSDYCRERDISKGFLLVMPQRQMASCMPAALKSWKERRLDIPEDQDDGNVSRQQLGPLTAKLADRAHKLAVDFETLASGDSKYARLHKELKKFFEEHPKDKVIVFSTFLGTLAYLADRLARDDVPSIILRGGGSRSKDDIIREFRSPQGPNVLLSSEVGGEGVDLQFSWVVINYDLPWNPMRVEQRIGRVDRLGQKAGKVSIWNLFYEDTVDARIYERLYEKLDLCRNALGDFEAILGEEIKKLTDDLLTKRLSSEQEKERIDQTAQALATKKQDEERLESQAAHLVAYGDYILRQVHAAREMNRWIDGNDLFTYVRDFLETHYPGCTWKQTDDKKHEYDLALAVKAQHDLSAFIRKEHLTGQTRMDDAIKPVPCRFDNRVIATTPARKEIISQFHPLVRFVSKRIPETATQVRPAVSGKISARDIEPPLAPGTYLLAVSLWSVRGLRDVEKLAYAALPLARPETLLDADDAERLANACASKGAPWPEAKGRCDLRRAAEIANSRLFGNLDARFRRYVEEEEAQNEDRADIQERNLSSHYKKRRESILRVIENLRQKNHHNMIPANEGRLRALEKRYERQMYDITSRRKIKHGYEDICVAVVLIK